MVWFGLVSFVCLFVFLVWFGLFVVFCFVCFVLFYLFCFVFSLFCFVLVGWLVCLLVGLFVYLLFVCKVEVIEVQQGSIMYIDVRYELFEFVLFVCRFLPR